MNENDIKEMLEKGIITEAAAQIMLNKLKTEEDGENDFIEQHTAAEEKVSNKVEEPSLIEYEKNKRDMATTLTYIIAGIFISIGVVWVLSANWENIPRTAKLVILLSILTLNIVWLVMAKKRKLNIELPSIVLSGVILANMLSITYMYNIIWPNRDLFWGIVVFLFSLIPLYSKSQISERIYLIAGSIYILSFKVLHISQNNMYSVLGIIIMTLIFIRSIFFIYSVTKCDKENISAKNTSQVAAILVLVLQVLTTLGMIFIIGKGINLLVILAYILFIICTTVSFRVFTNINIEALKTIEIIFMVIMTLVVIKSSSDYNIKYVFLNDMSIFSLFMITLVNFIRPITYEITSYKITGKIDKIFSALVTIFLVINICYLTLAFNGALSLIISMVLFMYLMSNILEIDLLKNVCVTLLIFISFLLSFNYTNLTLVTSGENWQVIIAALIALTLIIINIYKSIKEDKWSVPVNNFIIAVEGLFIINILPKIVMLGGISLEESSIFIEILSISWGMLLILATISLVLHGANKNDNFTIYGGQALLIMLAIRYVFNYNIPYELKGIAFIVVGILILIFNIYIRKKRTNQ